MHYKLLMLLFRKATPRYYPPRNKEERGCPLIMINLNSFLFYVVYDWVALKNTEKRILLRIKEQTVTNVFDRASYSENHPFSNLIGGFLTSGRQTSTKN